MLQWGFSVDHELTGEAGVLVENTANRLARDLFLLTAVSALFLLLFMSASFRITLERTWTKEARAVEDEEQSQSGMMLMLHLRRDGKIQVGNKLVRTPEQAGALLGELLRKEPRLRRATVIISVYQATPTIKTADLAFALSEVGLEPRRFFLRFTKK